MKKTSLLLCLLISLSAWATDIEPTTDLLNYYSSIANLSGDDIVTRLQDIIDGHTVISYSGLEPYYEQTDCKNGYVLDMYSNCNFTMQDAGSSQNKVCDVWNKEHSIPQSWFRESSPMKSDLFHVYPTDARVNNFRGNLPYGETSNRDYISGSDKALGHIGSSNFSGFSGKVYEPDDEYKGDFARTYMYMVTRYADKDFTQSGDGDAVFSYSSGRAAFTSYAINLFMKWHREDPVSEKEVLRNNAVHGIQKNRNPFIDYPYLAEYIWGGKKGESVNFDNIISAYDPNFVLGVSDGSQTVVDPTIFPSLDEMHFLPILAGEQESRQMTILGVNLVADMQLVISGDAFSVDPVVILADEANKANPISVTFAPTEAGEYTGSLTLSSPGAADVVVPLSGVCAASHTIQWFVNGELYTEGDPTTIVVEGNYITALPKVPKTCDEVSSQFVGWTQTPIVGTTDEVPMDLFSYEEEAPQVLTDMDFHAVFAHMNGTADARDSITMAEQEWENEHLLADQTIMIGEHVNMVCSGGSNPAKYYNSGLAVRVYGGGTVTFTADAPMTSIELSYTKNKTENDLTANVGTWNSPLWRGEDGQVVFTVGGTSGHVKIAKVVVTYGGGVSYARFITGWTCDEPEAIESVDIDVPMTGMVDVYTLMGQYIKTMDIDEVESQLSAGLYIIRGIKTMKLMVR